MALLVGLFIVAVVNRWVGELAIRRDQAANTCEHGRALVKWCKVCDEADPQLEKLAKDERFRKAFMDALNRAAYPLHVYDEKTGELKLVPNAPLTPEARDKILKELEETPIQQEGNYIEGPGTSHDDEYPFRGVAQPKYAVGQKVYFRDDQWDVLHTVGKRSLQIEECEPGAPSTWWYELESEDGSNDAPEEDLQSVEERAAENERAKQHYENAHQWGVATDPSVPKYGVGWCLYRTDLRADASRLDYGPHMVQKIERKVNHATGEPEWLYLCVHADKHQFGLYGFYESNVSHERPKDW